MKKIRINELARELEVKAHEILDRLPELGVTEKKTHSSSIDEDVAIKLRRLYGFDAPDLVPDADEPESRPEPQVDAAPPEATPRVAAPEPQAKVEEPVQPVPNLVPATEKPPVAPSQPVAAPPPT